MNKSNHPIFIGGLYKSGTSLIRAMLGQHTNLTAGLETYWFEVNLKEKTGRGEESLSCYLDRMSHFYGIDRNYLEKISSSCANVYEFLTLLLTKYTELEGKQRWVEKTPGNILHLDRILEGWPNAKIINIIRDPLDVFASYREVGKWDDVQTFVNMWCQYLSAPTLLKKRINLNENNYYEIRYERLVLEAPTVIYKVLNYLGEPWEDDVASFKGRSDDFDIVQKVTGKASPTLKRLSQSLTSERIGIWKKTLYDYEVDAIRSSITKKGHIVLFDNIIKETEDIINQKQ